MRAGLIRLLPALALAFCLPAVAQTRLFPGAGAKRAIERLNAVGGVLMIAAHPDDENTALLAYLALGRHVRTGYLSLTRGEGGQNLIGSEQGELLGLIRTQELLAARSVDGAEQFFTRAVDFGFSKTADETLEKWGREAVLSDIVWVIRRFRPDVIVLRFSGTPADGHGHHQSSAILAKEAFTAAADAKRFSDQLKWVQPWRATRLLHNVRQRVPGAGLIGVETGEFNPELGYSYEEIAGMSRSMHRSQAMGSQQFRGGRANYLAHVAGEPAKSGLFDGITMGWERFANGAPAAAALRKASSAFDPKKPESAIPALLEARPLVAAIDDPVARRKLQDLDEAIAHCAGLWLEVSAPKPYANRGERVPLALTVVNRSSGAIDLAAVEIGGRRWPGEALPYNQRLTQTLEWTVPVEAPYSNPFWLAKPLKGNLYDVPQELIGAAAALPALEATFHLRIGGQEIAITRAVQHRYVDRLYGEQVRPFEIAPASRVQFPEQSVIFPSAAPRVVALPASAAVKLNAPAGWPAKETGQGSFQVTPPSQPSTVTVSASLATGEPATAMTTVDYPHIPPQTVYPPVQAKFVRADIKVLARRIGYIMGAGDHVPEALAQLGCEVTLLTPELLATTGVTQFDAIVTGVRAYNVRPDLPAARQRLLDYVSGGGTLVVQYNTVDESVVAGARSSIGNIGPYPITLGRGRVTVEEAPVEFLSTHPVMQAPNKITASDFEGWVQERGLYFVSQWDPKYQSLMSSNDPGEQPLGGGTLYTRYGKGVYIFTSYAWFRQLPAGVPGAYRIFANFLSAGKLPVK